MNAAGAKSHRMFTPPPRPRHPNPPKPQPIDFGPSDSELERRYAAYDHAEQRCNDVGLAEFAYPLTQELRRTVGISPELRLAIVTHGELDQALRAMHRGVTPSVAMARYTGMTPWQFKRLMKLAEDPACIDPRLTSLRASVTTAQAAARSVAEEQVLTDNPLMWLMRGPAGRTTEDQPGWDDPKPQLSAAGPLPVGLINITFTARGPQIERLASERSVIDTTAKE